jgi:uncharacterized phiE125 gp8 family phage protein
MALKLKTAPAVEPITLAEVLRQLRLDITTPELSSGTLTIGSWYLITACQADAFYDDCAVGDTFQATAATALSASNKVREIYEGAYLNSLVETAREYVENLCGPLITQTWQQYLQDWPATDVLYIEKPRLLSVVTVKYTEDGEAAATFASSNYSLDLVDANRPKIVLNSDASWPSVTLEEVNPIEIEFTCGYGATGASVPEPIRLAMLLLVSQWYENRVPVGDGSQAQIPFAVDALLTNYRMWGF